MKRSGAHLEDSWEAAEDGSLDEEEGGRAAARLVVEEQLEPHRVHLQHSQHWVTAQGGS